MRAENGVSKSPLNYDDIHPTAGGFLKTSGAGESARKHGASLIDEEACADEDEDDDDERR